MVDFSDNGIIEGVARGDRRAVSRLITLCENRVPRSRRIASKLVHRTGNAHVIGITGAPGAGKSTLVDQVAMECHRAGKRVAVLAVDPSSPFSGGAILGDRIRMTNATECNDIFVRSMATRGALGGLSRATVDAVHVLDAAGFDVVIIETVGVGQAEVDIARTADTCCVVLVPGMGDSIQAMKAGIVEIADLFVINKADREGVDLVERDLLALLTLGEFPEGSWKPHVLRTVATQGSGAGLLLEKAAEHRQWLQTSTFGSNKVRLILRERILRIAEDILMERITIGSGQSLDSLVSQCLRKELDPYSAAERLISVL